ncbi:hypothetical protein N7456_003993 [Penicillium angulare]|uniref:Uncharacterized protein n=1 Tax=Penicillium angulare TaxID=116970 RepID=A0A9W9FVR9_9EURO|nr:hypothetical protein N7456_003993 [Penicillium angulare]
MTLTSECPDGWVHIMFFHGFNSDWDDLELLEYARDCVFIGSCDTSLEYEIPTSTVTGPYNDNMDRLRACDDRLVNWIREFKRGRGLPFDRNELFKMGPVYLQVPL